MRVVLVLALSLALVPAASSFNGELPGDVEDCAPGDAQRVVQRYVRAFNARNLPALDRAFAPAAYFNWFSTGAPGDASVRPPTTGRRSCPTFARGIVQASI